MIDWFIDRFFLEPRITDAVSRRNDSAIIWENIEIRVPHKAFLILNIDLCSSVILRVSRVARLYCTVLLCFGIWTFPPLDVPIPTFTLSRIPLFKIKRKDLLIVSI